MSMAFIREITFLSSSLAVFDNKDNILARFSYKVFISKMIFIVASGCLESASLSIIFNVHSDKIGWWSESWSKSSAILQRTRLSKSSGVAKIRSIILIPMDSLYIYNVMITGPVDHGLHLIIFAITISFSLYRLNVATTLSLLY